MNLKPQEERQVLKTTFVMAKLPSRDALWHKNTFFPEANIVKKASEKLWTHFFFGITNSMK